MSYEAIATVLPSTNSAETYNWLGLLPRLVKWVGERQVHKLRGNTFTIVNEDWAIGVEVTRDDLADDRRLGLVQSRLNQLGISAKMTIDDEVARILNGAFTAAGGLGYDGQFLIDTDHVAETGGTSQSNSGGTTALSAASLEAGIVAMMGFKDPIGKSLAIRPTHLVVGPAAWALARNILETEYLATGVTNINRDIVQLVVNPQLTGGKWFLVDMRQGLGPVIVQVRREPRVLVLDESSEAFYWRKDLNWGVDMSFGTGIGPWQTIYGSNAT
jgi:phage major head subunit gpT-like protein